MFNAARLAKKNIQSGKKNFKTTKIFSPENLHLLQLDKETHFKQGYWDDNKLPLKAAHKFQTLLSPSATHSLTAAWLHIMNVAAAENGKKSFIKSYYLIKIDSEESVWIGGKHAFLLWQLLEALIHAATCFSTHREKAGFLQNTCYYENFFKISTSQSHITILHLLCYFVTDIL